MSNNEILQIAFIIILILSCITLDKFFRRSHSLLGLIVSAGVAWLIFYFAITTLPNSPLVALIIAFGGTMSTYFIVFPRAKNRNIRKSVQDKKIEEFERKYGKKFNRKKYEFDHIAPIAKGGNNDENNIRIKPRTWNRKRGQKAKLWE